MNITTNDAAATHHETNGIPVLPIAGILLVTAVSSLAMGLLVWFLKRCFCCKRKGQANRNQFHNEDNDDHQDEIDMEEGREDSRCSSSSSSSSEDTTLTIPSVITLSRRSRLWGRKSFMAKGKSRDVPLKLPLPKSSSHSNRSREQRRRRSHRRSSRASSTESNFQSEKNHGFDHKTILTSSCSTSLPDCEVCDFAASKQSKNASKTPPPPRRRRSLDPPGARLESYPNATIQFRNPINAKGNYYFEDGEIDLLVDFLVHSEDYVWYPRKKLTVLLRAKVPETPWEEQELEHLRAIVTDAAISGQKSPLQVYITTGSNNYTTDQDLLRCAPTGGILVSFGSVWELPEDHPDFLKDLIV